MLIFYPFMPLYGMVINMINKTDLQYHINCRPGDVGKYCILPGDPGRCEQIAKYFDSPYHLTQNREYNIFCGKLCDEDVCVCSTGIGGPSTAIAVEELCACGVHTFIRIGTCGGISLDVIADHVVIATGAVRQEGTSHEYAPPEFPAVPNFDVLCALVEAAKESTSLYHTGIVQCKDSFYGQHSPSRMPVAAQLLEKWEAWKRLGVLASEMESAALFTVGAALKVRTGSVFHVVWNQERINAGLDKEEKIEFHDTDKAIKIAIQAIKKLILSDRQKVNE